MGAMVCYDQSYLHPFVSFYRSKNMKEGSYFPQKEIKYAPSVVDTRKQLHLFSVVSAKQGDGDTILPQRNDTTKRTILKGDWEEELPPSNSRSSKDLEEIISLFRRIRTSISRESTSPKKRSRQSSEDNLSEESVLSVLHKSQMTVQGKTRKRLGDKSLLQTKAPQEENEGSSPAFDPISDRLASKFVRRSPTPSPKAETTALSGSDSLPTTDEAKETRLPRLDDVPLQKLQEMKLPELKKLAKDRGIKGCSKLKKDNLVQLLSTS